MLQAQVVITGNLYEQYSAVPLQRLHTTTYSAQYNLKVFKTAKHYSADYSGLGQHQQSITALGN